MTSSEVSKQRQTLKPARWFHSLILRIWVLFRYQWLRRRYNKLSVEEIVGLQLVVLQDVFNPVLMRSGEFLARFVDSCDIDAVTSVLDLGTGTGAAAIVAARRSRIVVAVDINPAAVRCARINALLNNVENRMTVLNGDLFDPVAGRQFDLVLFNPPFFVGQPEGYLDHAWRAEDVFQRFANGLGQALSTGGQSLLLLSSIGEGEKLLMLLKDVGFSVHVAAEKKYYNELLTIYAIRQTA